MEETVFNIEKPQLSDQENDLKILYSYISENLFIYYVL